MKKITLILLFTTLCSVAFGQKSNNEVRKANKLYEEKKYNEAEVEYKKALEKEKESFEGNFNLGNALFRQERYGEAIEQYEKSQLESKKEEKLKQASIWHNIANSLIAQNMIDEGIEAYKNALRNNPDDDETRYNLAFAQHLRKKMQKENEQQQNNENKNNKDKNEQDKNKEQQDKEEEKKQEEDKNKQGKDDQGKDNQGRDKQGKDEQDKDKKSDSEREKKKQAKEPSITKANAEQILRSLLENEKDTQGKINRQTLQEANTIEKNW